MSERLTEKQVKEIRELIHEWRPFVSVLRDPLERTLLSEQAGWAEVDQLSRLVVSLQEQLRQASQCAEHWICLYHADKNLFQRQKREFEETKAILRGVLYEIGEIEKEADEGVAGSLERADKALTRILILSQSIRKMGGMPGDTTGQGA